MAEASAGHGGRSARGQAPRSCSDTWSPRDRWSARWQIAAARAGGWPGPSTGRRAAPRRAMAVGLLEAIRRANNPELPENSVRLRLACLGAVLVAIAACASLQEIAWTAGVGAMVLVAAGMALSHVTRDPAARVGEGHGGRRRHRARASGSSNRGQLAGGGITTVVSPLTVLLVSVLVVHSFHVPSRRDLLFSLGASAGLMAVGGALAIDLRFGLFVVAWGCCSLWGLIEMWTSASGGGRVSADGSGAGGGGDVGGGGRRLPRAARAGRVVAGVLRGPGRCRRLGRAFPGASPGTRATAAQLSARRDSRRPDSRRRVSRLRRQPRTRRCAGDLGNTLVMQVRAPAPLVLGR